MCVLHCVLSMVLKCLLTQRIRAKVLLWNCANILDNLLAINISVVFFWNTLYPPFVSYKLDAVLEAITMKQLRIWPFSDFLGVLPDHVVLPKDEEGPVDGEAVLPNRDGVVQCHGAGTLRFGLLEGWGDATCGHGRPISIPVAIGPSISWAQQARHIVSKPGHSVKSKTHGREDNSEATEEKEVLPSQKAGRGAALSVTETKRWDSVHRRF